MPNDTKRVMIVTGEASGDIHGAHVVRELKLIMPKIEFYGIGGVKMQETGVELHTNISELSVAGLVEVLKHYPRLRKILANTRTLLSLKRPDLLILIDSPDFNLPLAKTAHQLGIKVMYYISPQIWAWRKGRIKLIQKYIDMMAVVFPFEEKFYRDAGVPVEYVGHPLIKEAKASQSKEQTIKNLNLDASKKIVGLFPGSRASEVEYNYPVLLQAAKILAANRNDLQFITPIANNLPEGYVEKYITDTDLEVHISTADIYDTIHACDAIAAASGTVTLQITLMQTPLLIIYKISPTSYRILKKIVKFSYAGIANVIANKEISREFIQADATASNIASELLNLIDNERYTNEMKNNMSAIKDILGEKDGSATTAQLAAKMLNEI